MTSVSVFISYHTETGIDYARECQRVFSEAGHSAWMWDSDRTPGALIGDEIAEKIQHCDFSLYLATCEEVELRRNGQPWERNMAWGENKVIWTLTLDSAFVLPLLGKYNYDVVSAETVAAKCREIADQLRTTMSIEKPVARPS